VAEVSVGNIKLIQYCNEAYGLERRLETALAAHISIATRNTYKQRLRSHLTETKRHAREVERRIKQLGGSAQAVDLPVPDALPDALTDVAQTAVAGAQRAAALAQGPMHALRGTGAEEKQLKNAKTEYASESEEIATYSAILALSEELGDRDTARMARTILRDEQRMRAYLEKEIPRMVKAVAKAEIPSRQRAGSSKRRRGAGARSARGGARSGSGTGSASRARGTRTRTRTAGARGEGSARARSGGSAPRRSRASATR
jgi:ferritin-like metal-binding protein YciE